MSPSFSPAAARAYTSLAELGVQLTSVRVRLVNAEGTVVTDTTIAFPADQDTLTMTLPVQIEGAEQTFAATIELRDASGKVFFSSTQQVTARDASLPPAASPIIELQFVGPGASARTMTISPATGSITPGALTELVAAALDANGNPVTDLLIGSWTSSDTTIATVSATTGTAASVRGTGRRGVVTFTATTIGGVAGTAQLTFLPQPAQLALVGGVGLSGPAGHELTQPFVIQLLGVDGLGIANQAVAFRAVTAGGQVATATATTDVDGKARTAMTPGRTPGKFVFEATSGTLSATLEITAVVGEPSQLIVTQPLPASLRVGEASPLPFQGHLADDMGNAVTRAGVTVTAAVTVAPGGQSFSVTANTDANGDVSITLPAYVGTVGTATIALSSPLLGAISTTTIPVLSGAAAALTLVQQPAAIVASGVPIAPAPVVQLVDAGGNPVTAVVPVTVALGDGLVGTLGGTTTVPTGANGRAKFDGLTIGALVGNYTLKFTAGSLAPLTSNAIGLTAGAAARLAWLTEPPASIEVGAAIAPTPRARLVDAQGNPVRTANVKLRKRGSGGNGVYLDSAVTDANGEADLPIPAYRGTIATLRFAVTADGLDSLVKQIVARAGAPAGFILTQAPPATAIVGAPLTPAPVVQLVDAGQNPVAAPLTVTASLVGAVGTVGGTTQVALDADGKATFSALTISGPAGQFTLSLGSGALTPVVTAPITVGPGAPSQLAAIAGAGQSAPVATAPAVAPAVRVTDAVGNPVPGVRVVFTPSIGSTVNGVAGPDAVTTDANGTAAARGWTLGSVAGSYSLSASVDGLTGSPVVFEATAVAGAAAALSAVTAPPPSPAGSMVPLSVKVSDARGNGVGGVVVSWAVTSGAGTIGATSTTDAAGIASSNWTLGLVVGPQSATASASGVSGSPATFSLDAGQAPNAKLVIVTAPSSSARSGIALATQPVVQLMDVSGTQPVAEANVAVTAALTVTTSTLGGTVTALTDVSGRATFTDLTITGPAGGSPALVFTATGYANAISAAVATTAGVPVNLTYLSGSGAGQTGAAAPVRVKVTDAAGNPVAGRTVTWTVGSGGGSVGSSTTPTDASGIAATAWTLGFAVGPQTMTATADFTAPAVDFTMTVSASAGAQLRIVREPAAAVNGAVFSPQPEVQLYDASGSNVIAQPGVGVTASLTGGSGTLQGTLSATTNAFGRAQFTDLHITGAAGSYQLAFTASGFVGGAPSGVFILAAGAPATITAAAGDGQTGVSNLDVAIAPKALVRDASGNPVPGATVTFTAVNSQIASGGGLLTSTSVATDGSGLAALSAWRLGATGSDTVRATVSGVPAPAVFAAADGPGVATHFHVIRGSAQSAIVTTRLADTIVVESHDANHNRVPNVPMSVNFTGDQGYVRVAGVDYPTNCGDCVMPPDSTNTGANGQASFVWFLGNRAKADSVLIENATITADTLTAVAQVGPATAIVFSTVPATGFTYVPLQPIQAFFTDIGGVDTVDTNISATLAFATFIDAAINGTRTRPAVHGVVTFDDILLYPRGQYQLKVTADPLTSAPSSTIDVASQVPTHLVVVSGNDQIGLVRDTLPIPIVVELRDAAEHPVPNQQLYFYPQGLGGQITSGTAAYTDGSGRASFTWQLGAHAQPDSVLAWYSDAFSVLVTATANAGPATQLVFDAPAGLDDDRGNILSPFTVRVSDVGGVDTLRTATGAVTIALVGGDGVATTGTLTRELVNGVATFDDVVVTQVGIGFTFTATTGSLNGTSVAFDISEPAFGPAYTVDLTGPTSLVAGESVTIGGMIKDASGRIITNATDEVTLTISGVEMPLRATPVNGLVSFGPLRFTQAQPALGFSSFIPGQGYTGQLFIDILAGPASALGFQAQPVDDNLGNVLNEVRVFVSDEYGNGVSGVSVGLTLEGSPGTLGGTTTVVSDASGVAAFGDLLVDALGTYTLRATAGALTIGSNSFSINPPPPPAPGTIAAEGTGRTLVRSYGAGLTHFIVKDASGSPLADAPVTFAISDATSCYLAASSSATDSVGMAWAQLNARGTQGGCFVTATTANGLTASARFVSIGNNVTHVWFGTAGGGETAWNTAGVWEPAPSMTPGSIPSSPSSDDALVVQWTGYTTARLFEDVSLRRIRLTANARVNLANKVLKVYGDSANGASIGGSAGSALVSGKVVLYSAGEGGLVDGVQFENSTLAIGDTRDGTTNDCASNTVKARVRNILAYYLDVRCPVWIAEGVEAFNARSYADAAQPSAIHVVASGDGKPYFGQATLDGDTLRIAPSQSLWIGGSPVIGSRLEMEDGSYLYNDYGASVTLNGSRFINGGRVTIGSGSLILNGSGRVNGGALVAAVGIAFHGADTLSSTRVQGPGLNAPLVFDGSGVLTNARVYASDVTIGSAGSEGYVFSGDTLHVTGNLLQQNGRTSATFAADATHTTSFEGSAAQKMIFALESTSHFGNLVAAGGGGLTLAGNASLVESGNLSLLGVLNIPASTTLAMNGGMLTLGGPSVSERQLLNVDGTLGFGGGRCVNTGGSYTGAGNGSVNVIAGPVAPGIFVDVASGYCASF